jgi:hypothetical protein
MPYGGSAYGALPYGGDFDHYRASPFSSSADGAAGFWWFGPGAVQNYPFAQDVITPAED